MLPSLSVQSLVPLSSSESRTAALFRISRIPDRSRSSAVAVCAANSSRERREISSHHHIRKDRAQNCSHSQSPPVECFRATYSTLLRGGSRTRLFPFTLRLLVKPIALKWYKP